MSAREIKELCFAREALSRFPGNENQSYRLDCIVTKLIDKMEEEQLTPIAQPKPSTDNKIPF